MDNTVNPMNKEETGVPADDSLVIVKTPGAVHRIYGFSLAKKFDITNGFVRFHFNKYYGHSLNEVPTTRCAADDVTCTSHLLIPMGQIVYLEEYPASEVFTTQRDIFIMKTTGGKTFDEVSEEATTRMAERIMRMFGLNPEGDGI